MSKKKRPITSDDLWSMKRFGAASLSPDGRSACVAVSSYSMAGNDSTSHLWLLATDGSAQRQLTRGQKDSDPQWSPRSLDRVHVKAHQVGWKRRWRRARG